ncbi:MAG: ERCC4 domain-containing protein [Desulfobacterales bacterium]|jgi:DNA excision repair protein ERCC-4
MLNNNLPIQIISDDREHKSEVIQSLLQIEDVEVSIERLTMGDYQIDNRLIIERKTLKDFAISIIDGRLFKQMIRLANSKSESVLILEGTAGGIADLGLTREAMQGALITVSLILGIPVLRSKDPSETAKLIVFIARQIESMARGGVQRHGYRPKTKKKRQLFILQGLPGVGPERAERLLARFGSVEAAISASSSQLQSVDGIGKSIADKIRWVVSERGSNSAPEPCGQEPSPTESILLETQIKPSNTKKELLV